MAAPAVSVITAAYNAGRFVEETLTSIVAQTYQDFEMIVVDDGSTDDTRERVLRFAPRVTLLSQANGGVAAALNAGLRRARGAYVTFLDADDVWVPRRLERVMRAFEHDRGVGAVYHGYAAVDEAGAPLGGAFVPPPRGDVLEPLLCGLFIGQSMITLRRACFDRAGIFDTALRTCPDWDLLLRVALSGERFCCVSEALVRYRIHGHNLTRNFARLVREGRIVLDRAFADPRLPRALQSGAVRARAYGHLSISVAARCIQQDQWSDGLALLLDGIRAHPRVLVRPSFYLDLAERALPLSRAGERQPQPAARSDRAIGFLTDVLARLFEMPNLPPEVARRRRHAWSALWVAAAALQNAAGRRPLVVSNLARALHVHPATAAAALVRAGAAHAAEARPAWNQPSE